MGHWKKIDGKLTYFDSSFQESSGGAIFPVDVTGLKAGGEVKMNNKLHTYLGSTQHVPGDESSTVHHFQATASGDYSSYPTNTVPPMQSRDQMENGDNSDAATDEVSGS